MDQMTLFLNNTFGETGSNALASALLGLAILIIGLLIVKFLTSTLTKLLSKVSVVANNELVTPISSLVNAVLTVFVLLAVLDHFGLTNIIDPLEDMLGQFLSAVPRIIGASVVAYAGWIIAKIVSQLVRVALEKVDKRIALKTNNDGVQISKFASAFVFVTILLPISVAALDVLNIDAITIPASSMINELMSAVPNIVGAAIILLVTYFSAKFVIFVLTSLLAGMQFDELPSRVGLTGFFTPRFTPTKLVSVTIMFFAMITAATAAVDTLGIEIVSSIFAKTLDFGGGILVGIIILIIGSVLSDLAYSKLTKVSSNGIASVVRYAIMGLVLAMGLRAMGLADEIVNMAFGFIIGGFAVAAALAFGLGGRDAAKRIADNWASRILGK